MICNAINILINILCILFIIYIITNIYINSRIDNFTNNLSKKQIRYKKTLEDMKNILDKNNINFFLIFGTALGAHREKKFIEHDNDIDLGLYSIEFDKIAKIKNDIKKKFYIKKVFPDWKNPTEYACTNIETGVKVDLFQVLCKDNNKCTTYTYTGICDNKPNKRCEYLDPINLIDINFMGKKYKVPDKDFLKSAYGSDWRIPKKFGYSDGLKNNHYKSLIN